MGGLEPPSSSITLALYRLSYTDNLMASEVSETIAPEIKYSVFKFTTLRVPSEPYK